MSHRMFYPVVACLLAATPAAAQSPLPVIADVEWGPLRTQCRHLRKALHGKLPADTEKELARLLDEKSAVKPDEAAAAVQKLLDAHCLVGVNINPEGRVKVARGPAAADLRLGEERLVLVKVHNEAGVTHALRTSGPQLRTAKETGGGRWLEATVATEPPLKKTLSGHKLEYVVLRLTPREAGKREATLGFDVGQGTQDLGFRGEVPVLFTVRR